MRDFVRRLERSHEFWIVIGLSFFFFLFRLPSLFEPYWYGDEGIYETIGLALSHGRILYTQIWDNKPPLLYYTYALVHSDQFLVRSLSLLAGLSALIVFFLLAKKLFTNRIAAAIATGVFAILFGLPSYEGNIANAENFMLLPIILAGLLIYNAVNKSQNLSTKSFSPKWLILAGILLGIAFLYKIVAIFDFAGFFAFFVIATFPPEFSLKTISNYLITYWQSLVLFVASFILPFFLSLLYFLLVGGLHEYIHAVFQSTVGYVGYNNAFIIPQGLLISKVLLLGFFVLCLFVKRHKLSKASLFILIWIGFSLFNAFFSQRPYTHYLIVLIPSFALLIGQLYNSRKTHLIPYAVIVILVAITAVNYFNHWDLKGTINYYGNFISFMSNKKSMNDYDTFFDKKTARDSELVNYINSHIEGESSLFVWGNSAQLYPQTGTLPPGRFTVAYHISGIKPYENETADALKKNPPQFIITMDDVPNYPYPLYNYSRVLRIQNATIYERID